MRTWSELRTNLGLLSVYIFVSLLPIMSYGLGNCNGRLLAPDPRIDLINAEYTKNWKLYTGDAFAGLSAQDIEILNEFGFAKDSTQVSYPDTFSEFVQNVQRAYEARAVPKENQILPGVLMKSGDQYQLFTPGVDFIPPKWKVVGLGEGQDDADLRLLPSLMAKSMKNRRYPVFATGHHDTAHFLVFVREPVFASQILKFYENTQKAKENSVMKKRRALLLEVLALAKPESREELERNLLGRQGLSSKDSVGLEHYSEAYNKLDKEALLQRSELLVNLFKRSVKYYGAGFNLKEERDSYTYDSAASLITYRDTIFGAHFGENTTTQLHGFNINSLAREGFHNLSSIVRLISGLLKGKTYSNDINLLEDMHKVYLPELLQDFKSKHEFDNPDDFLEYFLRQYCARTEYFLWETATRFVLEVWFEKLGQSQLAKSDPLLQFIQDLLGENSYTIKAIYGDVR